MNRRERRARTRAKGQPRSVPAGPPAALAEAIRRHRSGDLDAAEAAYVAQLEVTPAQPEALHFLGVLRHQQQRTDEGVALVRRALAVVPDYVDAWNNLGNMYKESGRLQEAEEAYRHALALDFDHAGAWNNLGIVLRARGHAPEAVGALRRAVECAPGMTDAYVNLGAALRQCRLLKDAIEAFRCALATNPGHARAHKELGRALYLAGQHEEAESVFRSWAAVEPGNPIAAHMLAACSGRNVPARASDDFIRTTFDEFAESFDEMLLHRLDYRAPELLVAALRETLGTPQPVYDILDAGCGTGLCGVLLKPFAHSLTGVDLSASMLKKAKERRMYDRLVEDEITRFLNEHVAAFDVVASADTLCYFGDLAPVTQAAFGALRPGGWLSFTLERADDIDDYRINPHGRYSHARAYVDAVLDAAGFRTIEIVPTVLRQEAGQPVGGWIVRADVERPAIRS
jgi:predicted TPR repeat methyltransferase